MMPCPAFLFHFVFVSVAVSRSDRNIQFRPTLFCRKIPRSSVRTDSVHRRKGIWSQRCHQQQEHYGEVFNLRNHLWKKIRGGSSNYNDYDCQNSQTQPSTHGRPSGVVPSSSTTGGYYRHSPRSPSQDANEDEEPWKADSRDEFYGNNYEGKYYNRKQRNYGSFTRSVDESSLITSLMPTILSVGDRRIGLTLLGAGAVATMLGISLFFNKSLLRLGNVLLVAGVPVTLGPPRVVGYFIQPQKARATACLGFGVFLVLVGWPVLGLALEVFGLMNLFGNLFPLVLAIVKQMPVVGSIMNSGGGAQRGVFNNTKSKSSKSGRRENDNENDAEQFYYGRNDRYYGRQPIDDDRYYN